MAEDREPLGIVNVMSQGGVRYSQVWEDHALLEHALGVDPDDEQPLDARAVAPNSCSASRAGPVMSPSVSAGPPPTCVKRSPQSSVPVVSSNSTWARSRATRRST